MNVIDRKRAEFPVFSSGNFTYL